MKHIIRGILILLCIFIILSLVFRPKVLRENHGGGGGHGGGGHGGGRGWARGWGGGSYAVNPLYIYDDYEDDVYYSYPYYFF